MKEALLLVIGFFLFLVYREVRMIRKEILGRRQEITIEKNFHKKFLQRLEFERSNR